MRITERKYLDIYLTSIGDSIFDLIQNYDFSENKGGFDYLTKSSAVYSSNIEGNSIDLNSYMNYEIDGRKYTEIYIDGRDFYIVRTEVFFIKKGITL